MCEDHNRRMAFELENFSVRSQSNDFSQNQKKPLNSISAKPFRSDDCDRKRFLLVCKPNFGVFNLRSESNPLEEQKISLSIRIV